MPWISKRPPSVEGCYCVGLDIAVTSIGLLYAPTFNCCWYKYDPLVFFFLSLQNNKYYSLPSYCPCHSTLRTYISPPVFRREPFGGPDHFKQRASVLFYIHFFLPPVGGSTLLGHTQDAIVIARFETAATIERTSSYIIDTTEHQRRRVLYNHDRGGGG